LLEIVNEEYFNLSIISLLLDLLDSRLNKKKL